ncbi:LOW QUALITY PROTEIN: uncharacterized protein LOC135195570 [Macrobrachium nipponense]|uniref:LOW QUALITY PROTEIN: uncharacterized protein LOC135195570 n=1 Tax=Macrobrachium nipponense TaxID=159736 RepID=UPI0030C7F77A
MSDSDSYSATGGGEMAVDEEDVDEIRLGPLVDELAGVAGRDYTREEMVQALINSKFDVRSAVQWLSGRETSIPREGPGKRKQTFEGDNILVRYQLPSSYCHSSAIIVENKTLDRLPLHRIIRDWLSDILRKRSRQKREEEKARYFRNRNESQCSEDSVVTTSGDSQDILGDSSQDLSEDSQDMVVDNSNQDSDKDVDKSLEACKVHPQPVNELPANTVELADGGLKENSLNSLNFNMQSLPVAVSNFSLAIPPSVNASISCEGSGAFQVPCLKVPFGISNKTGPQPQPFGVIGKSETGTVTSCDNSGLSVSESPKSSGIQFQSGTESKGPSLSELASSSLTGSKPQFDGMKGPSLSELANSNLTGSKPQFDLGVKGPSLSELANSNLTGSNSQMDLGVKGPSLSRLADSNSESNSPGLTVFGKGVGSSGIQFSVPKLNTVNSPNSFNFSAVGSPKSLSSVVGSNICGNDPNFNGKSTGSSLSALAASSLGNSKPLSSSVPEPGKALSLSKSSPVDIKCSENPSIASGSPSLSALASTYLGSDSLSITSVPPLELGKRGKLNQGIENAEARVGESNSVLDMTGGFSSQDRHGIAVTGTPPMLPFDLNLNNFYADSPVSNLLGMSDLNRPFGDQMFLSSLEKLALSTGNIDSKVGFHVPPFPQPKPGLKPPPGFEHFVPHGGLPEKECLETLLKQEEEVDINGDIDLLAALLKPEVEKEPDMETVEESNDLVIDLQVCPFQYDATLWKRKPSSFGRVMVNTPHTPKIKRLTEKIIQVPFKIFRFDTPSPDEMIQEALQNRRDPGWYKLVTKERLSRR